MVWGSDLNEAGRRTEADTRAWKLSRKEYSGMISEIPVWRDGSMLGADIYARAFSALMLTMHTKSINIFCTASLLRA
jgi:hypothetical protein